MIILCWSQSGSRDCAQMRHLYVVIDMSDAMESQDLKPTRVLSTLKVSARHSGCRNAVLMMMMMMMMTIVQYCLCVDR